MKHFKVRAFLATSSVLGSVFSQGVATNAFWGENVIKNVGGKLFGLGKNEWKGREREIRVFVGTAIDDDKFVYELQASKPKKLMWKMLVRLTEEVINERKEALKELCDSEKEAQDLLTNAGNELNKVIEKLSAIHWDPKSPLYCGLYLEYSQYSDKFDEALEALNKKMGSIEYLKKKEKLHKLAEKNRMLKDNLLKIWDQD